MTSLPFKVMLVDDEPGARAVIRDFLHTWFPDLQISGEASGIGEAIRLIEKDDPQLVFLDVEMEDGSGFDLLDKIRDPHFNVIFVTAHDDFAIRAFRYNAVDYLLKPIDPEEFVAAVHKVRSLADRSMIRQQFQQLLQSTRTNTFDRITLSTGNGLFFARTQDITRIETYGNYTFVYLTDSERLLVSRNLKEFEEMLPEPDFFRVHQSHMVNTTFVKKYVKGEGDHIVMADGTSVPVSRRRKEDFIQIINRLFSGR